MGASVVVGLIAAGVVAVVSAGGRPDPQVARPADVAAATARVDASIPAALEAAKVPGAAVAVVLDWKVVWHRRYGHVSADSDAVEVTGSTVFQVGSISKPVAAAAILQLGVPLRSTSCSPARRALQHGTDLGRFAAWLASDDPDTVTMRTAQAGTEGAYGLGVAIDGSAVGHLGVNRGCYSRLIVNPSADVGIVVLTNGDGGRRSSMLRSRRSTESCRCSAGRELVAGPESAVAELTSHCPPFGGWASKSGAHMGQRSLATGWPRRRTAVVAGAVVLLLGAVSTLAIVLRSSGDSERPTSSIVAAGHAGSASDRPERPHPAATSNPSLLSPPSPVVVVAAPPAPAPAPAPEPPPATSVDVGGAEAAVLAIVNEQRATAGCSPVTADSALAAVAGAHSADMADRDFFDHVNPDGQSPWDRARAAGVMYAGGENIAAGQADAAAVMDAWMKSPGHRANILNCEFTKLGTGILEGRGGPWWTQLFGY